MHILDGAAVSHLAELVRGNFVLRDRKAPSSALRAPSPQRGEGGIASSEFHPWNFNHEISCLKHLTVWRRLMPGEACKWRRGACALHVLAAVRPGSTSRSP